MTFTDDDNERGRAIANSYAANEARRNHEPPEINWDDAIARLNLTPIPDNDTETHGKP